MSANTTLDMTTLEQLSPLIRIFAHPLRLRILDFLETSKTPQRVTEIVGVCEGAQQAIVSQQLKIMRDMGILNAERRKNCVYYSIKNSEILYFMGCVRKFDLHVESQAHTPTAEL
ncbi:MAG: ArsR family transcriptional regulator [Armatimonadetes bacterium]|jgi:DNA-binding transcriptional ArsR family regulator|nr:ArsR family transcriptional regulator [Armatimonadota bacterium]